MSRLTERLLDAAFHVYNLAYPSTRETFGELVASLSRVVEHDSASCPKIDFVGYSLGALLVRGYLRQTHPKARRDSPTFTPSRRMPATSTPKRNSTPRRFAWRM
jgi:triacylglycerol esterase/lipase EstA (alpha/beta hydrolase family)